MPVNYDPQDAVMCWPEGDYPAVLEKVEDKTSKVKPDGSGGNPMQVLTWRLYKEDGREQLISDYIVIPAATFKLKQLAIALGKRDEFEKGTFQADDQVGCNVVAEVGIESQPNYDDKNKIGKVKSAAANNGNAKPKGIAGSLREKVIANAPGEPDLSKQEFTDDSIPF